MAVETKNSLSQESTHLKGAAIAEKLINQKFFLFVITILAKYINQNLYKEYNNFLVFQLNFEQTGHVMLLWEL